jgi:hypothetical protein
MKKKHSIEPTPTPMPNSETVPQNHDWNPFRKAAVPPSPPSPEAVPPDYPLELVAHAAAHLLRGNDYAAAARRAMALIDVCRSVIADNTRKKAEEAKARKDEQDMRERTELIRTAGTILPWKKAVLRITGKRDETKATAAFRSMMLRCYKGAASEKGQVFNEDIAKKRTAATINYYKQVGVSVRKIEEIRSIYTNLPGRAPRKPRTASGKH